MNTFMVFDVESIGLHGPSFWWAAVVVDPPGEEIASAEAGFMPDESLVGDEPGGTIDGLNWVREHCLLDGERLKATGISGICDAFWSFWQEWKARGAVLAADCPWPVEANFLSECIGWDRKAREWEGPYPFIDVASIRLAAGFDPLGTEERLPGEMPPHDPLADTRQSARLLIEALDKLGIA